MCMQGEYFNQSSFSLRENLSENGKYNPISVNSTRIRSGIICVSGANIITGKICTRIFNKNNYIARYISYRQILLTEATRSTVAIVSN